MAFDPVPETGPGDATVDSPDIRPLLHFAFEATDGFLHDRGRGANATCTTCPTSVAGPSAGSSAARFDGNACITVPSDNAAPPTVTITAWVLRASMTQGTAFGKPSKGDTSFENSFEIYGMGGSAPMYVILADATLQIDPVPAIGTWHHIAGVFDAGTFTTFVDGTMYNSATALSPIIWGSDAFMIGCDRDGGVELSRFVGDIDEVRLYDRALAPAEIMVLATP